jgi:Non-ribosomal peptide synthetase modules and related proteins
VSAKFDLSVSLAEQRGADGSAGGLSGVMEYASDLFDRASVEALAGRLVRVLEAAVAAPEVAIGRLEICRRRSVARCCRLDRDGACAAGCDAAAAVCGAGGGDA